MRERLRVLLDVTADAVSPEDRHETYACTSVRQRPGPSGRTLFALRVGCAGSAHAARALCLRSNELEIYQEEEVDGEGPFGLQITRDDYMHTLDTGQSRISIPPQPQSQLTLSTTTSYSRIAQLCPRVFLGPITVMPSCSRSRPQSQLPPQSIRLVSHHGLRICMYPRFYTARVHVLSPRLFERALAACCSLYCTLRSALLVPLVWVVVHGDVYGVWRRITI